ncbi:MAG: hypothetical protein JRD04_13580 [Deltaproteobacteria bacterium]|nr:hypothetical protein [Deltaproteobacteria bacterium]
MLKKAIIVLLIGLSVFSVMHFVSSQTRLFLGIERNLLNGLFFLREPDVHETNPLVSREVVLLALMKMPLRPSENGPGNATSMRKC